MTDFPLFPGGQPAGDIAYNGNLYRPYVKGMEEGFDRVKSGERRPYGWGRYLFPNGYIVFDAATGRCIDSIRDLPADLKRAIAEGTLTTQGDSA